MNANGIDIEIKHIPTCKGVPDDVTVILTQEGRDFDRKEEKLELYCEDSGKARLLASALYEAINEYTYY